MIDVEFSVGGSSVSAEDFGRVLEEELFDQARLAAEEELGGVYCPVHGRAVEVRTVEQVSGAIKFVLDGCCEEALQEAERVMNDG